MNIKRVLALFMALWLIVSCVDVRQLESKKDHWYALKTGDTVLTIGYEYNSDSCEVMLIGNIYTRESGLLKSTVYFDTTSIANEIVLPPGQTMPSYVDSVKRSDPMYIDPELLGDEDVY